MKIIIYCQHVLGVGHFFRTLEIAKAMHQHDVVLVTGGGQLNITLPDHVRQYELPGLMMDKNFKGLFPTSNGISIEAIKKDRRNQLINILEKERPDVFLIELFPFGRKAFRFELEPALDYLKNQHRFECKVVCSLRDILVEKEDKDFHERRVVNALNQWFDAVLIHSDPLLTQLSETFDPIDRIQIPMMYTGFVTPMPEPRMCLKFKEKKRRPVSRLIIASAGGGNVGGKLLDSVIRSHAYLADPSNTEIWMFTGPYMSHEQKMKLLSFNSPHIRVEEFCTDFVSALAIADLSISMAGYNTCMNILAAGIPSLVWPFDQNSEQGSRVTKLKRFLSMNRLDDNDLNPRMLAKKIDLTLTQERTSIVKKLNLDGSKTTVKMLQEI